jgi:hypothetical protein
VELPSRLRLTEEEKLLVLTWRAFRAYASERLRPNPDREHEEALFLEVHSDTSVRLRVERVDSRRAPETLKCWRDMFEAPEEMDAERLILEKEREERDRVRKDRRERWLAQVKGRMPAPPVKVTAGDNEESDDDV